MALEKHFCSLQPQGLGCSNGREKILILLGMILPTASFTFFYFTGAMFTTSLWVRERGNLDCGLTPACVRGGPRPAPPTTTLPWWGPGRPEEATSWSRQSSAGPLTEIIIIYLDVIRHIYYIILYYSHFQKMTLDLVLDKFKATGCPFLEHADAISSQELNYGVVFRLHICLTILTSPSSISLVQAQPSPKSLKVKASKKSR